MIIRLTIIVFLTMLSTISLCESDEQNTTNSQQSTAGEGLYEIRKHTISSGGGVITAGVYTVTSSIGQIDAGHIATGGIYKFRGGFLVENSDLIFRNSFE